MSDVSAPVAPPIGNWATLKVGDLKSRTGLELLRAKVAGKLPARPISRTLGFLPVEIEEGRVVFAGLPTDDRYDPNGWALGGYIVAPDRGARLRPAR